MECYKDKAVGVITKFYMAYTKVPYEERFKIVKRRSLEYLNKMHEQSKNDIEKKYYESILFYLKKIKLKNA
jgi:hypothetical protein